jgi:hypothetical protein
MKVMGLMQCKFLRIFILVLLVVFSSESVYASGSMIVVSNTSSNTQQNIVVADYHTELCHEMQSLLDTHEQSRQQQDSHSNHHSSCNHCLACFSIIPQQSLDMVTIQPQVSTIVAFSDIYQSPTSAQPQKPPIL